MTESETEYLLSEIEKMAVEKPRENTECGNKIGPTAPATVASLIRVLNYSGRYSGPQEPRLWEE